MAKRNETRALAAKKTQPSSHSREPQFPYTTTPNSLRGFLKQVPTRPVPPKITTELLKAWGFGDTNASTIIRVLKKVDLLDTNATPTANYKTFMQSTIGPATLGGSVRRVYAPLFEASHEPYKETEQNLRLQFNIHSGGGEQVMKLQVQTFKVLCEFATFDGIQKENQSQSNQGFNQQDSQQNATATPLGNVPAVHIDLHIHLPENKSVRDYQAIIEDIARYIYRYDGDVNG